MHQSYKIIINLFLLLVNLYAFQDIDKQKVDIIVAKDGSGDFESIQDAINSVPKINKDLKIILLKNGIYEEQFRIDTDFIALVGENRDSTIIRFYKPMDIYKAVYWDSVYADYGRGIINIYADDVIIANLTAENTQTDTKIHAFTVYSQNNTRTIIINCNLLSNGGDTVSLWNGETGMYYLNSCYLKGAVDFLCPRGWCYAENIEFYCTRTTTPLWHDGSKNEAQKFVIKNAWFDGIQNFRLGRNHHDGAFYLINNKFSKKLLDQPFYRPKSSKAHYKWGRRTYFYNCIRETGDFDWHKNNLYKAIGSPNPEDISPKWTFGGVWNPEETLPVILPMAFLLRPEHNKTNVGLKPDLNWVKGRNAIAYKVFFGTNNPPNFVSEIKDSHFETGTLETDTDYFWRIDTITKQKVIVGQVQQFHTLKK